jgi:short-subunit dehydrogenase
MNQQATEWARGTAVITGASSGIGSVYADRLARRGHDLILIARDRQRRDALAIRLSEDTGRSVEVIVADLNDKTDLARAKGYCGRTLVSPF